MNGSIFWRIFWKEYRTQRSFWLSVAVGTVLLQLMVLIIAANLDTADSITNLLFAMAVLMPTFYALGCGAIMYAMETEEGTYDLIRMLPSSALRVFGGKLAFGLTSCLLLPVPLLISAWLLARFNLPDVSTLEVLRWTTWLFGFLAWGLFFSILTSHVLHAVCFAACFNSLFIVWMIGDRIPPEQTAWAFVPIALLFALDAWLADRWMRGERFDWPTLGWTQSNTIAGLNKWISRRDFASPSARLLRRLVWEEVRNARILWVYLPAAAVGVLVSYVFWHRLSVPLREIIFAATPLFLGTCAFHGSQSGHLFRFYAERGVAPAAVWMSKHLVWIPVTATALVVLFAIDYFGTRFLSSFPADGTFLSLITSGLAPYTAWRPSVMVPTIILVALSMYGAGQLASLFVRSVVTATVFALVIGLPIYGWHLLLIIGQVPPILAAILPAILFVATYLRTPNWILERSELRDWLKLLAVMALLFAFAVFAIACFRVFEIPSNGPGFDVREFNSNLPQQQQSAGGLQSRIQTAMTPNPRDSRSPVSEAFAVQGTPSPRSSVTWTPALREWLTQRQSQIPNLIEMANPPNGAVTKGVPGDDSQSLPLRSISDWFLLLQLDADRLLSEGKLDEAFTRYTAGLRLARQLYNESQNSFWSTALEANTLAGMHSWIETQDQTPARLVAGLREIESLTADRPPIADGIKVQYEQVAQLLKLPADQLWLAGTPAQAFWANTMGAISFWESARLNRVIDAVTANELQLAEQLDASLSARGFSVVRWASKNVPTAESLKSTEPWRWFYTSVVPQPVFWAETLQWDHERAYVYNESLRRATLVTMALVAWRLEHGALPERLDQLVPVYFEQLPLDPWSGEPFQYRPQGFPTTVEFDSQAVEPNQPLIWTVGERDGRVVSASNEDTRFIVVPAARGLPDAERKLGYFKRSISGLCLPYLIPLGNP